MNDAIGSFIYDIVHEYNETRLGRRRMNKAMRIYGLESEDYIQTLCLELWLVLRLGSRLGIRTHDDLRKFSLGVLEARRTRGIFGEEQQTRSKVAIENWFLRKNPARNPVRELIKRMDSITQKRRERYYVKCNQPTRRNEHHRV